MSLANECRRSASAGQDDFRMTTDLLDARSDTQSRGIANETISTPKTLAQESDSLVDDAIWRGATIQTSPSTSMSLGNGSRREIVMGNTHHGSIHEHGNSFSTTYNDHQRRQSSAMSSIISNDQSALHKLDRPQSTSPLLPKAPIIMPKRLPSIGSASAKSTWRLSFSADRRGNALRHLSQDHGCSSALLDRSLMRSKPAEDLSSPTRRWFFGEGLRSTSQMASNDNILTRQVSDMDMVDVDGAHSPVTVPIQPIPLHELNISKRLASSVLRSSTSSPQLSELGGTDHQRVRTPSIYHARWTVNSRARYMRKTSESQTLSECAPASWGQVIQHPRPAIRHLSSGNSSTGASLQNSQFDLGRWLSKGRDEPYTDPLEAYLANLPPYSADACNVDDAEKRRLASVGTLWTDVSVHTFESKRKTSIAISAAEGALPTEHGTLSQSSASRSMASRNNTPLSSRFREEFALEDLRGSRGRRLSRILRLNPRKTSTTLEDVLAVPPHRTGYGYGFANDLTSGTSPLVKQQEIDHYTVSTPVRKTLANLQKVMRFGGDGACDDGNDIYNNNEVNIADRSKICPEGRLVGVGRRRRGCKFRQVEVVHVVAYRYQGGFGVDFERIGFVLLWNHIHSRCAFRSIIATS